MPTYALPAAPIPSTPTDWPAGVWNIAPTGLHFRVDGVAAFLDLRLRHLGWQRQPAPTIDVDAALAVVERELATAAAFQDFTRRRSDVADAERAVASAKRDLLLLDADEATAKLDLRGSPLALQLAALADRRNAAREHLAALGRGLLQLRRDLIEAREKVERFALPTAANKARDEAGPRIRSRAEILADLAAAAAPFIEEYASWTTACDPTVLLVAARREFLSDAPPEVAD